MTLASDPGWTAVLPLISGLALETAGQLSHGAVLACEYGVPAVVVVPGAAARIRDSQEIEVDGTAGTIVLKPAE